VIAWKWEYLGGIIFTLIGLGLSPFIFNLNHTKNNFTVGASLGVVMMITFPFVVVGILFIISHILKKKKQLKTLAE
jgi:hypothetical protein